MMANCERVHIESRARSAGGCVGEKHAGKRCSREEKTIRWHTISIDEIVDRADERRKIWGVALNVETIDSVEDNIEGNSILLNYK